MPKVFLNGEYVDVPTEALFADDGQTPFASTLTPAAPEGRFFTEEDVARIRQEEKDKLYSQIERNNDELRALREQVGSLTAAEQRREAQLLEEQQRLEAEARVKEEEELDAKTLLQRREDEWRAEQERVQAEWESRWQSVEQQRLEAEALAAKEREFNDLKDYAQQQVAANEDRIAPQLRGLVGGNSRAEIDASIARVVEATEGILAEVSETLNQNPGQPQVPVYVQPTGVVPTAPAALGTHVTAPVGADPAAAAQTLTPEQIASMPMDQYARLRGQLNIGNRGQNRGLFG